MCATLGAQPYFFGASSGATVGGGSPGIPHAATPTFTPPGGTYADSQTVTIATTTGGAAICYTIDSTTPTASAGVCTHGTLYTVTVLVTAGSILRAISTANGWNNSAIGSAAYGIGTDVPTAPLPTFTPTGGTFTDRVVVTIVGALSGATTCFTTGPIPPAPYVYVPGGPPYTPYPDPTALTPGLCSAGSTVYNGPMTFTSSTVVKALTTQTGLNNSGVASTAYTIAH